MRIKEKLLFLSTCFVLIVPVVTINQLCQPNSIESSSCPQNSFCNSKGYCQCNEGWALNCNIKTTIIDQKSQQFEISQEPSYFKVIPTSTNAIYVYRFHVCVENSSDLVSLNVTLYADDGIQTQFSNENFIGQIRLDTNSSCGPPIFSPYLLFDFQPNGKIEQMILQVNKMKRQSLINIQIQNKQIIIIQTPKIPKNSQPASVGVRLSVNEIFLIDMGTLWLIVILFILFIFFSFIAGIGYCFFAVRRSRRFSRNIFLDNNLDHFEEMLPKCKVKHNNENVLSQSCPVCLLDFQINQYVRTTQCNHIFHSECLDIWCKKNLTCPVCRSSLDKKYLLRRKRQTQTTNGTINCEMQEFPIPPDQIIEKSKQNIRESLIN